MESARVRLPDDFEWRPVDDGAEMAVVHGDPAGTGGYVIRFRTDREIVVPLHWHRHDEHITVVQGPFSFSINNQRSALALGSSVVIPAKVHHSTWYGAGTMIQVSGTGPFESVYVDLVTLKS